MSRPVAVATAREAALTPMLRRFAHLVWRHYRARLYLFGSRARGTARQDSDYDLVAVSDDFAGTSPFDRALDQRHVWRQAGGWGIAMELHCYTRGEFWRELRSLGYLNSALRRGELVEVKPEAPESEREAVS